MVPFAGYDLPVQYAGVIKEHQAVRGAVGMFDVSHMGRLEIEGPRAVPAVDRLVTNTVGKLADNQAIYTVCCNERGTILDDLIVYRRSEHRVLVVCNASNRNKIRQHFLAELGPGVDLRDVSDETALIAVQGPAALPLIDGLAAGGAVSDLPSFGFTVATLAGVETTTARTGYTGEDGVEILCAGADAPSLWAALLEAGEGSGIAPCGLAARDTLRLEARLSLYGQEIDESIHPYEAGLGWVVKLGKESFIGKRALEEAKAAPLGRKLVGFEMTGRGIARHGYPIVGDSGEHIGVVTSGSPGPTVGKNIGLGYVPADRSKIGTQLGIEIRGKTIDAVVVKTPFYRRSS